MQHSGYSDLVQYRCHDLYHDVQFVITCYATQLFNNANNNIM